MYIIAKGWMLIYASGVGDVRITMLFIVIEEKKKRQKKYEEGLLKFTRSLFDDVQKNMEKSSERKIQRKNYFY